MLGKGTGPVLVTRADKGIFNVVRKMCFSARWHHQARMVVCNPVKKKNIDGFVAVVTAGTADIPVAEEAAVTAESLGNDVRRLRGAGERAGNCGAHIRGLRDVP